jgi:hypothetical protein
MKFQFDENGVAVTVDEDENIKEIGRNSNPLYDINDNESVNYYERCLYDSNGNEVFDWNQLIYEAIMTQVGTSDPIIKYQKDNFGGISCVRTGIGRYEINSPSLFGDVGTEPLFILYSNPARTLFFNEINILHKSPDVVEIRTYTNAVMSDSVLENTSILIKKVF